MTAIHVRYNTKCCFALGRTKTTLLKLFPKHIQSMKTIPSLLFLITTLLSIAHSKKWKHGAPSNDVNQLHTNLFKTLIGKSGKAGHSGKSGKSGQMPNKWKKPTNKPTHKPIRTKKPSKTKRPNKKTKKPSGSNKKTKKPSGSKPGRWVPNRVNSCTICCGAFSTKNGKYTNLISPFLCFFGRPTKQPTTSTPTRTPTMVSVSFVKIGGSNGESLLLPLLIFPFQSVLPTGTYANTNPKANDGKWINVSSAARKCTKRWIEKCFMNFVILIYARPRVKPQPKSLRL